MPDIPYLVTPGTDQFSAIPAGFTRTASGRLVPAQAADSVGFNPHAPRKLLVVLQYWQGDLDRVDELAQLIADMERVHNPGVDILLFGRKDCPTTLQFGTVERLRHKFGIVHDLHDACNYEQGFPWAANAMWQDLVRRLGAPVWTDKYRAFLNLEWDCVPVRPGWLNELGREFDHAAEQGLLVAGALQADPLPHVNGVALYSTAIGSRIPALLGAVPPDAAYDIIFAPKILPVAMGTHKIQLDYRRPTISAEEILTSPAALYHGVRDRSALCAVRDEHVNHVARGNQTFGARTVLTFNRRTPGVVDAEKEAQLEMWNRGWLTAGWNPVVLSAGTAQRHPQHAEFMARVATFPLPKEANPEQALAQWERWLAFAVQGGGTMAAVEVLPSASFRPEDLAELKAALNIVGEEAGNPCLVYADKVGADFFVQRVLDFIPPAKATAVTVADVLASTLTKKGKPPSIQVAQRNAPGWREAKAVHFSAAAVKAALPGYTISRAQLEFLRGL